MMRENNKGVSLIELVVSIGIMSIVLVIASAMIINASKYFEKQMASVELQNEAQIIINYLTETIMEATDMNFTVTDASTGAGVYEFYKKNEETGLATAKGSQRVLHYYYDATAVSPKMRHLLYMVSFDTGTAAPAISYGSDEAKMYLISDEITEFNITFDYGEEATPESIVDLTPSAGALPSIDPDEEKTYVVKNPLRVKIIFRLEHNGVGADFEITADCRNTLDDITYTKSGVTTTFKAYNR